MRVRREVAHLEAEVNRTYLLGIDSERMATTAVLRLEEDDILALLVQQEGGGEACDACADDGHALARLRRHTRSSTTGRASHDVGVPQGAVAT